MIYTLTAEQMQQVREAGEKASTGLKRMLDMYEPDTFPANHPAALAREGLGAAQTALALLDAAMQAPEATGREGWLVEKDVRWWLKWFEEGRNRRNNAEENKGFERVAATVLRMALAAAQKPEATAGGDVREAAARDLDKVLGTFADKMPGEAYHRLDSILRALAKAPSTGEGGR